MLLADYIMGIPQGNSKDLNVTTSLLAFVLLFDMVQLSRSISKVPQTACTHQLAMCLCMQASPVHGKLCLRQTCDCTGKRNRKASHPNFDWSAGGGRR